MIRRALCWLAAFSLWLPGCTLVTALVSPASETDCSDGRDNNGDGLTDCDDPDCIVGGGCGEQNCSDGVDDDEDGALDCADPDCLDVPLCRGFVPEATACADGFDNDFDGLTDCADIDCNADPLCLEQLCDNGEDDDGDGALDCNDPDCVQKDECASRTGLACTSDADCFAPGVTDDDVFCAPATPTNQEEGFPGGYCTTRCAPGALVCATGVAENAPSGALIDAGGVADGLCILLSEGDPVGACLALCDVGSGCEARDAYGCAPLGAGTFALCIPACNDDSQCSEGTCNRETGFCTATPEVCSSARDNNVEEGPDDGKTGPARDEDRDGAPDCVDLDCAEECDAVFSGIGGPCSSDLECGNGFCVTEFGSGAPYGFCSLDCEESDDCGAGAECVEASNGLGICVAECGGFINECNTGYTCVTDVFLNGVCLPNCEQDTDCPYTEHCDNESLGVNKPALCSFPEDCSNGIDDGIDELVDCQDPECSNDPLCP